MNPDESFIRHIVQHLETAWNASDSAAFAAPFLDDAEFVDVLGRHHQGRTVIEAGHRQIFDTIYRGSRMKYDVETVRFLKPDIALTFVHATLLSRLGNAVDDARRSQRANENDTLSEGRARPTFLLVKQGEHWQIAAFQNTKVAEGVTIETV